MLGKALLSASVSASEPPAVYVEDVFSTYLYTGNGSTQTITNGIDLAGEWWVGVD
jgi:GH25 family lysozyme M1 (1,4-beta-N-acetylmuramidase)